MITLEHAHTIGQQLGLNRPSSRKTIRRVARAHDIIRRHTEFIVPIKFDGETYHVPSQQIWFANERKTMSYKVRVLKGFPSCDCPDWRHASICFRGLPIVPYICKHGLAILIMKDMRVTIEHTITSVPTHETRRIKMQHEFTKQELIAHFNRQYGKGEWKVVEEKGNRTSGRLHIYRQRWRSTISKIGKFRDGKYFITNYD